MLAVLVLSALAAESIALPGGPPVGMDYLVADTAHGQVWVPAGNTGTVDVVDIATGKVTPVGGFPTAPPRRPGRPNMGPSSATVGDGVAWIGNRGDNTICSIDARTLARGACRKLPSMPDGVAYVSATREVWVTTPRDRTITIVPVSKPDPGEPASIKIDGDPEGLVIDQARGIFYTNLEDHDRTLAIDVKTRKVVASFPTGCGENGPRGLAIDAERRLLFVACSMRGAVALDLARDGKEVGSVRTGSGVDNIDYAAKPALLLIASGQDGKVSFVRVAKDGALDRFAWATTVKDARCVVAGADGTAYVASSAGGRLIVVKPPK
jgi:DNA-binding beta-propeller fold protein YncE